MRDKERKHFAYMAIRNRERGFTFLSTLFAITILFLTLPLLPSLLNTMQFSSSYNELATQAFFQYLRDDTIRATDYKVKTEVVTLSLRDGKQATIEQYKDQIRRRVDGGGHEIYLRNIKDVKFYSLPFGFRVKITTDSGEKFEKTIVFYK